MAIFVDTSALYAVLDRRDEEHDRAERTWRELLDQQESLIASNYVAVECHALVQKRMGMEIVRRLEADVLPALELVWGAELTHRVAAEDLLFQNQRRLSLVDCVSFLVMRSMGLTRVFTFDPHFAEEGFEVLPAAG